MPRLVFHGIEPVVLPITRPICRFEGARLIDREAVLAEYQGTFWKNREGYFTAMEFGEVGSIQVTNGAGTPRVIEPRFDVRIAGNVLWNGQSCLAILTDSHWIDHATGETFESIELRD
jgi:hypothetical protein